MCLDDKADLMSSGVALRDALAWATAPTGRRPFPEVGSLGGQLEAAPQRKRLILLIIAIAAVISLTAAGQVRLNAWNQPFYDAIAQKDLAQFGFQLFVFTALVSGLLILNVTQTWLHATIKVKLRESITRDLIDAWLQPGRAFRVACAGEIGINPDQRIHEDARRLTELTADLAIGLFQASLLLVSFVGVLWFLSTGVTFSVYGSTISIPGYMVWCALLYAVTGSLLSWRVGRPLITLNAGRYAQEAQLRFSLVRVSEHSDAIALYRGETGEHQRLENDLDRVLATMRALVGATARLTWITSGYGWFAIVAPIVVAAPAYFGGSLSFGALMMVVGAFYQVQQALRWFVDNFAAIADWRATMIRVAAFRAALQAADAHEETGQIAIEDHPTGHLSFTDFEVVFANNRAKLNERQIEVAPGERLLIIGKPGSGKSTLFRAIAGIWPWGGGVLRLPPRASMMFLPQHPYVPLGTLRAAVVYPAGADAFKTSDVCRALERTGLSYLSASLDRVERWDKELTLDEQQRVALARLVLHRPNWIVLDEAVDVLDEDHRQIVLSILDHELAGSAVISISRHAASNGFYTRIVHLEREPLLPSARRRPCPPGKPGAGVISPPPLEPYPPRPSAYGLDRSQVSNASPR
jgi:vitamin B12/bleomycin/antimicrobial peptide transport system ATP-binding/permease protein